MVGATPEDMTRLGYKPVGKDFPVFLHPKTHEEYAQLNPVLRRTVRMLASILRVAESLDRSHAQVISALELQDRGNDLLLQVGTSGDAELEVWAAQRHLAPFEQLMQKPVRLEAQPVNMELTRQKRPRNSRPIA
mgnify:CR=1 FL=1